MAPVFYRHDRPHLPRTGGQRALPHVELEILRGRAQNRVRPVKVPAFLIGSATDCDLVLGDSRFPEAHSYLLLAPGEVSLRWLGFGPEVAVNGRSIQKSRLQDGDLLRMGPYEFRIAIQLIDATPDTAGPQILRLNRIPPDDLDSAAREIRGLLAEIRRVTEGDLSSMRLYVGREKRQAVARTAPQNLPSGRAATSPPLFASGMLRSRIAR